MNQYYFAVDALPAAIQEAFDNLRDELTSSITLENAALWEDIDVVLEFDSRLEFLNNDLRIRYLSSLSISQQSDVHLAAGRLLSSDFHNLYFSWLAVRFTETLCAFVGNNLLRSNQEHIASRWEQTSRSQLLFRTSNSKADELLHFLFTTLIPQARVLMGVQLNTTSRVSDFTSHFTRANQQPQPLKSRGTASTTLPQTIETLCCSPFTPKDLSKLLIELGVLDAETERWHLGELKTKAAFPKSAFPAAYRALAEAHLLLQTDAPVYRQIFEQTFAVDIGDRTANYKEGKGSTAFHDYLNRARYWIKIWKTKL